ncbi:hypothetical protein [Pseudomonas putida]|uniref:Uncharacterized protein n=1 Tax=Pseudomonas putida TaxID=303 RepID=A0A8I1JI65_PSEPU|nr:hypothetical protein [Pseudomonas putida]MBI6882653.1 hypothetical protein [Pseudomonas putida]
MAANKPFNPSQPQIEKSLHTLLEGDYWLNTLGLDEVHARRHDDCDGEGGTEHQLQVYLAEDVDIHVFIPGQLHSLRFRDVLGGGQSPRVRNALMVLAEAIRRDNEDRPQPKLPAGTDHE